MLVLHLTVTLWTLQLLVFPLARAENDDPNSSLCFERSCACETPSADGTIHIKCDCFPKQVLRIGGVGNRHNARVLPENVKSMSFESCHHVEMFSNSLSRLMDLKNISLSSSHKVVLHSHLYHPRHGARKSMHLHSFEMRNVKHANIKRQSFEGISIDIAVRIQLTTFSHVPPLAFNFDHVNEFEIQGSTFDRISVRGFKLDSCNKFIVTSGSRFLSVASQAFMMRSNAVKIAHSVFYRMQDAALEVRYGTADIVGNTFQSLSGRPFSGLEPIPPEDLGPSWGSGLIFKKNKFAADPTLPFNSLAMPGFNLIKDNPNSHLDLNSNHFPCDCERLAWVIKAVEYGLDREAIAEDGGSFDFLKQLYVASGSCLRCSITDCEVIPDQPFLEFAKKALIQQNGEVECFNSADSTKGQKSNPPSHMPKMSTATPGEALSTSSAPSRIVELVFMPTFFVLLIFGF